MILLDTARRPQHIELVALLFSSQTVLALCQWASLILLTRKINTFFFLQYPASLGEKHEDRPSSGCTKWEMEVWKNRIHS